MTDKMEKYHKKLKSVISIKDINGNKSSNVVENILVQC